MAQDIRRRHGGRLVPTERFHVSLNFLGAPPAAQTVAKACEAVAGLRQGSFVVAFNRVANFGGQALVLWGEEGVIGVLMLHAAIHAALAAPGVVRGQPPTFEPHMTLLRDAREVPAEFVQPVSWRARELVLIDSGEGRHRLLGRWPLEG